MGHCKETWEELLQPSLKTISRDWNNLGRDGNSTLTTEILTRVFFAISRLGHDIISQQPGFPGKKEVHRGIEFLNYLILNHFLII